MRVLRLTSLICALALVVAGATFAGTAAAKPGETVFFEAPRDLLGVPGATRLASIAKLQSLGVHALRVVLYWRDVAPHASSRTRPNFNQSNPAAYHWDSYDALINLVTSLHWKVLLTVSGPVPRWATAGARDQYTNPSSKDFQLFMTAVGRHYGKLVKLYSIWNEPNQPQYLRPQYTSGRLTSPALYRSLFLAGYAGLKASGHFAGMKVLMGETSPIGVLGAGIPAPLAFLRGVLCLDGSYHPVGHCAKLPADGYAQHPYTSNLGPFWVPGGKQDPHHDDITIATLGRLTSALDRAAAAGAISSDLPIYVTEFGIQSYPNHTLGVPLAQQAEFQAISEKIAWSNPRVVSFDQYLLRDDPPSNGFQSGLETYRGAAKPVYGGFRLPLVVTRTGSGVSLWGLVRPATDPIAQSASGGGGTGGASGPTSPGGTTGATGASGSTGSTGSTGSGGTTHGPATIELQYSGDGGRTWRRLLSARANSLGSWSASGHWVAHRMWRVRWVSPTGTVFAGAPTRAYTTSGKLEY